MTGIGNTRTSEEAPCALFVDWSNVYLGRREAAHQRGEDALAVRVSAQRLATLMAFGRPVDRAVAVVNGVTTPPQAIRHIQAGFRAISARPAAEGFEQTNDALLRERMWSAVVELSPSVMVLASGDGNGWEIGEGFSQPLLAARRQGWAVEVLAWRRSLHRRLANTVAQLGGAVILLDDYYDQVTFVEGGRVPMALNLTHRPSAEPTSVAA